MNPQKILVSIMIFLIIFIIFLATILFQPPVITEKIRTLEQVIQLSTQKIDSLKSINATYKVELYLTNKNVTGELNFFRNTTTAMVILSPSIKDYEGYGIMPYPNRLIDFITENNRGEFFGEENDCYSTITEPVSETYKKLTGGDYLVIACFHKTIGYPSVFYASEVLNDNVIYSNIYVTNFTYSL